MRPMSGPSCRYCTCQQRHYLRLCMTEEALLWARTKRRTDTPHLTLLFRAQFASLSCTIKHHFKVTAEFKYHQLEPLPKYCASAVMIIHETPHSITAFVPFSHILLSNCIALLIYSHQLILRKRYSHGLTKLQYIYYLNF